MSEDFEDISNLDDLFSGDEETTNPIIQNNYLFVGRKKLFDQIYPTVTSTGSINFQYVTTVDEAIDLLLVDLYALVMLDNESPTMDLMTVSRIVRVNHPLARIVALSNSRRSLFIADIINHGSVDSYIPLPIESHKLQNIIIEQQAKHDINRMLTNFVSQPPKLSSASYLLLDPSLSSNEEEPVKFVGMMIAYKSVPRYSKYFEDLLAKDEILFAGYLSGITMLGQELMKSDDPLKEINFGGISVIFRFHDEIQFSVFVRNLSKHNYLDAEEQITSVIDNLLATTVDDIESTDRPSDIALDTMDEIVEEFDRYNDEVSDLAHNQSDSAYHGLKVMMYGTDEAEMKRIKNYLGSKVDYSIVWFTDEHKAKTYLKNEDPSVLLLDSDLVNLDVQRPLDFADFVKDEFPFTQVIYLMRDRRASSPIIRSLNSGAINYLLSYRTTRKDLNEWIHRALDKSIEIRDQSHSDEVEGSLNAALAAKTRIRQNEASYLTDNKPEFQGVFIAEEENPLFKRFWGEQSVEYNDSMLAGMVASLESVGDEMFYDHSSIGGLELGESNLLVEHREDFNFIYFISNIGSHNVELIKRHLSEFTDNLFAVIRDAEDIKSETTLASLDTKTNNIFSDFLDIFG